MNIRNYLYTATSHQTLAIHRQLILFDPISITQCDAFMDIMASDWGENSSLYTVATLLESEMNEHTRGLDSLPVSYSMLYKTSQIHWVNLIIRAVFEKKMFALFGVEYDGVINGIYQNGSVHDKEYAVYRDLHSGTSVFESAGRVYLSSIPYDLNRSLYRRDVLQRLKLICDSYEAIGDVIGQRDIIIGVIDVAGNCMRDNLTSFCQTLIAEAR